MIVDYVVANYGLSKEASVVLWRETINGFHQKQYVNSPQWSRDDASVHEHLKRFGPGVFRLLRDEFSFTVVPVSAHIRKYFKNGDKPVRDAKCRTDSYFKDCMPSACAARFGFVLFPRNTNQDHPLVLTWLNSKAGRSITVTKNTVSAIDVANGLGNLSDSRHGDIRGTVSKGVRHALENKHPLFSIQSEDSER